MLFLLNTLKKTSFLEILFLAVIFILAATYSFFIGSKGFAGFDLSPMISLAQSLHQGNGFHDFIDNPFSPGFDHIFCQALEQTFG